MEVLPLTEAGRTARNVVERAIGYPGGAVAASGRHRARSARLTARSPGGAARTLT